MRTLAGDMRTLPSTAGVSICLAQTAHATQVMRWQSERALLNELHTPHCTDCLAYRGLCPQDSKASGFARPHLCVTETAYPADATHSMSDVPTPSSSQGSPALLAGGSGSLLAPRTRPETGAQICPLAGCQETGSHRSPNRAPTRVPKTGPQVGPKTSPKLARLRPPQVKPARPLFFDPRNGAAE